MPTCLRPLSLLVAVALPLLSVAQSSPTVEPSAAPTPRFYVGLAAATSLTTSPDGFPTTPTTPTTHNNIPVLPKLTVGWQLLPRLAVQVSAQYAKQNDFYGYEESHIGPAGDLYPVPGSASFRFRSLAVPVLARYTFTKNLTNHLQADILGGATLVRRTTHYHYEFTQPPLTTYENDRSTTDVHLSLGPSLRYRIGSHVEVTADVLATYQVDEPTRYMNGYFSTTYPDRFSAAGSLGLRYRFGR